MAKGNHNPNRTGLQPGNNGRGGRPRGSRNRLTIERVEKEIRDVALVDPLMLFTLTKDQNGAIVYKLRPIQDIPPHTRAAIASVKVKTVNLTAGDAKQDEVVEIRFWDKVRALEMCAEHFGWIKRKIELELGVSEAILARLDAWKRRNLEAAKAGAIEGEVVKADPKP